MTCCALAFGQVRARTEAAIQAQLDAGKTTITLPAGMVSVHRPIVLPRGARGLRISGHPSGTILKVARDFEGRAVLVGKDLEGVALTAFEIDGNRDQLPPHPLGIPPWEDRFIDFYDRNGIVVERSSRVQVAGVRFRRVSNFPLIISSSSNVTISAVRITDSGSLNTKGRNNTSGGILLEDGTSDFTVRSSTFLRIRGNAVWTHSRAESPRNARGLISGNTFSYIGRDAIQVGHATEVRVERNRGSKIGYPSDVIDSEAQAWPVGIDTAGDVDKSVYSGNVFHELNGKCIDLDGFHHGEVSRNTCINSLPPESYPYGHCAVVMNNTYPKMRSEHIRIVDNLFSGTKYGGIFVIGRHHTIERNRMLRINRAACNESAGKFPCLYNPAEPDLLQAGIYLSAHGERPDPAQSNIIRNNVISGHNMKTRCIAAAPGVDLRSQTLERNDCRNNPPSKP